jgi:quercetin dioxygenase-like cupin family protein
MRLQSRLFGLVVLASLAAFAGRSADAAEPPKKFNALGHKIEVKLDRAATKDAAAVLELIDAPGMGPPKHVHSKEDEIFHVLRGQIRIWRGDEVLVARPGTSVFMPRNIPHTYQNIGKSESRVLVIITPGSLQSFFEEASAGKLRGPRDNDEIAKLAERYGIKILGPPPGAETTRKR